MIVLNVDYIFFFKALEALFNGWAEGWVESNLRLQTAILVNKAFVVSFVSFKIEGPV